MLFDIFYRCVWKSNLEVFDNSFLDLNNGPKKVKIFPEINEESFNPKILNKKKKIIIITNSKKYLIKLIIFIKIY